MTALFGPIRKLIFGISPEETNFTRRGFQQGEARQQQRLEQIGRTFLYGYHAALIDDTPEMLGLQLNTVEAELRGFAFEGAAMGLSLLDQLTPWKKNRFQAFLDGPGATHLYMVYVGAGWALARLRRRIDRPLAQLDPLLRWLVVDGYGFHEGYFHWRRSVKNQVIPDRVIGYARRVFDQGLGRSIWFVDCADVGRIPATIAAFPPSRQADLWSGVGLACAYAGGADHAALAALKTAARPYGQYLAQGAAFAAKARQRAGNPAMHTEIACDVLCCLPADAAARITDMMLEALPFDGPEPAYEVWRRRIQAHFAEESS